MELKRIAHKLTVCKVADISEINIIKGGAFDGCAALKTIAIPDSVKEIGTMESGIFESRIVITGGVQEITDWFSNRFNSLWSDDFAEVSAKSHMRGYRDIYSKVGTFHKLMIRFCDGLVRMKIAKKALKKQTASLK